MSDQETERPQRITVSEETLRRVLAEFKVELMEMFQTKASQEALERLERTVTELIKSLSARVLALELWQAGRDGASAEQGKISSRQLAWAALVVAIVGSVATIAWLKTG